MPERELRQLVLGIGATLGIEAFVWLTDMGGLSREEAVEVMRSNARCCVPCLNDQGSERVIPYAPDANEL